MLLDKILFALVAIPIGYVIYHLRESEIRENLNYLDLPQTQIHESNGDVLNADGWFRNTGFAVKGA